MAITGGQVGFTGYQQPDYSGVVAASALPLAALSKSISDFSDYRKKQKEEQTEQAKQIKQAESIGNLVVKTMPEYADMINPSLARLGDQNIPLSERVLDALNITDGFKQRLNLEGIVREREMDALKMQQLRMSMQPAAPVVPVERKF